MTVCGTLFISPAGPQRIVEFFVRVPQGGSSLFVTACSRDVRRGPAIDSVHITPAPTGWTPVILATPGRRASTSVAVQFQASPVRRRSTSTTSRSRPSISRTRRSGRAAVRARHQLAARRPFPCIVDTSTLVGLHEPVLAGRVRAPARTRCGRSRSTSTAAPTRRRPDRLHRDAPPPPPPPPPPIADADGDGVPDADRQLPGERQHRPGRRRRGRRRRRLRPAPAGQRPARAGRDARSSSDLRRGVRQAARARSSQRLRALPGRRLHPAQGRRLGPGRLDRRRAQGRARAEVRGQRLRRVRPARQAAVRRGSRRASSRSGRSARRARPRRVDLDRHRPAQPAGAEAACRDTGPSKGVVRSVSMVAKGFYRTLGGASTATATQRDLRHHRPLRRHRHRRSARAASRWPSRAAKKPVIGQARAAPTWPRRSCSASARAAEAQGPPSLAALEVRRAALGGRAHALPDVLGARAQLLGGDLELQRRRQRGPRGGVDQALGQPDGDRRAAEQLADELVDGASRSSARRGWPARSARRRRRRSRARS